MNLSDEATLCGIMIGDGCLCLYCPKNSGPKYTIDITLNLSNDLPFANQIVLPLLNKIADRKVRAKHRPKEGKLEIVLYSKKLFYRFHNDWEFPIGKKGEIRIPDKFLHKKGLLRKVLAGIFATDGTLIFSKQHKTEAYYPRFEFSSSSSVLLNQIYTFFKQTNYKTSKWKNRVAVNGFWSAKKFIKEISLINPKHQQRAGSLAWLE